MPHNDPNIELRSDEVKEILGQVPRWIIRQGILLIFLVILIVLLGSWFFQYPHIIESRMVLTTENPPADLMARVNGKINHLLVEDNQMVSKGTVLAFLENPARMEDVWALRLKLDSMESHFINFQFPPNLKFSQKYRIGEIQSAYTIFLKQFSEYHDFLKLDYYARKIELKKEQLNKHREHYKGLMQQQNILEKELEITYEQFHQDSILYRKNVISMKDYQKSQKAFLAQSYTFHGGKTLLANAEITISTLQQEITDMSLRREDEMKTLQNMLAQAFDNLKAQLDIWEQNYLLRSPIDGTVSFNRFWSSNQNVKVGDCVFTVIPNDSSRIIARVELPIHGAGKVKTGQRVNIKLDNYPYMEYGMLEGKIQSISRIPEKQKYNLDVFLTNGMDSNYGIRLKFAQKMEGTAEIITDDIRLLQRIFNPIRALFSERVL